VKSPSNLLDFVSRKMTISGPYQPLIIQTLLRAGGTLTRRELAQRLLLADEVQLAKAERVLMRWPLTTLTKHHVISYDKATKAFSLTAALDNDDMAEVIAVCSARLAAWKRVAAPKRASRFYRVIERAGGRCQACGVLAKERSLDVDHIVPQSRANMRGEVKTAAGEWLTVDDDRNLQALCYVCNRGKRDSSTTDFRPSVERLAETIVLAEQRARRLGYDDYTLREAVRVRRSTG
jgi:5-methylcytosine-specific restriction endonuclease McrA